MKNEEVETPTSSFFILNFSFLISIKKSPDLRRGWYFKPRKFYPKYAFSALL